MATPTKHARLAPSAADRWMHCPGSVAENENVPRKDTVYTREGTLAHAMGELKLRKYFGLCADGEKRPMGPRKFKTELEKLKSDELYQPEMDGYTDEYVDYIKDLANSFSSKPAVFVEVNLNLSDFVPGSFGQADCILLHGSDLYINDFKYGKGVVVPAENNPQLMLYALGALMAYKDFWQIDSVHMAIIQPRAGGIKEAVITTQELSDWGVFTVRPAAQLAAEKTAEYHSGDWCRWCAAAATCREHATTVTQAVEDFKGCLPPQLTPQEFGDLLHKIDPLLKYAEAAKTYAESALLQGEEIPGWKLVEGRSKRVWDDQTAAFADLTSAGLDDALLWHREPYTLAQIEKQMGKKDFAAAAGTHIVKQPGKPALAEESDSRPAWSPKATAEEDFKDLIKKGDTNNA
ncbi:DUF2800 domain-containing protein [Caproicibacterium argilliputei]|uniref:DUF2800 domain-containing protein n=1 Tax=Caproicibacterium argilliputei TaxID=3030016 RepID=A0AA97H454_9FIRM|nr:DUF2800 domain-containing protein [Caproicibacterium argilliputei]WOC33033.1 DUF2800 domain-containing protein [Caproicibacterium argilliputei]